MLVSESPSGVLRTLEKLSRHGWVPLLGMARLLGYTTGSIRGIYQRQRGQNAIPTIKVGGHYRVYEADVLQTLEAARGQKREDAEMILTMYRAIKKREQREKDDA